MKTNDIYEVLKDFIETHDTNEVLDVIKDSQPHFLYYTLSRATGMRIDINESIIYNEKKPDINISDVRDFLNSLSDSELEYAMVRCHGEAYVYGGPYDSSLPDDGSRKYLEEIISKVPENYEILKEDIHVFRENDLDSRWKSMEIFDRKLTCDQLIKANLAKITGDKDMTIEERMKSAEKIKQRKIDLEKQIMPNLDQKGVER